MRPVKKRGNMVNKVTRYKVNDRDDFDRNLDDLNKNNDIFSLEDDVRSQNKRKRHVTLANAKSVIGILKGKDYKKFKPFIDEIERTLREAETANNQKQGQTQTPANVFDSLNDRMKAKDDSLYKQLMVKIHDSDPKKDEFQSVSIKRALIERLKNVKKVEDPVIKDLVNWAIESFLTSQEKSVPTSTPKKVRRLKKRN